MDPNATLASCVSRTTRFVKNNTVGNVTDIFCQCYIPYYGPRCEKEYTWFYPYSYVVIAGGLIASLILTVWSVLKCLHLIKTNAFDIRKLSIISFILDFGAIIFQFAYRCITAVYGGGVLTGGEKPEEANIMLVAITAIMQPLLLASSLLMLGFWYDVLFSPTKPKLAQRTKIVSITASILVSAVTTLDWALYLEYAISTFGTPIAVALTIIYMTTIVTLLHRFPHSGFDASVVRKKKFAVKMLTISIVGWAILLGSMASTTLLSLGHPWSIYFGIPTVGLSLVADTIICVSNLLLIDRTGGLLVLTRHFCCSRPITDPDRRPDESTTLPPSSSLVHTLTSDIRSTTTTGLVSHPRNPRNTTSDEDESEVADAEETDLTERTPPQLTSPDSDSDSTTSDPSSSSTPTPSSSPTINASPDSPPHVAPESTSRPTPSSASDSSPSSPPSSSSTHS